MAFSIQQFASKTAAGFLKPSNFLVYIYYPEWALARRDYNNFDLAYLASATSLPGVQVLTEPSRLYGQGPVVEMPYDIGVTEITIKFYVDSSGSSLAYFYDWVRNIVNLSHNQIDPRGGAFSNQLSYRSEYATNIEILLFEDAPKNSPIDSPQDAAVLNFTLYDAFPKSISETTLDWQSGNEIMTFNVTFVYRSFEFKRNPINTMLANQRPDIPDQVPVDLADQPPEIDFPPESLLDKMNRYATNIRESSARVRTESVSMIRKVEAEIYNNEYIKTAQNVISTVKDVRSTINTLKGLNNSLKRNLVQNIKGITGGTSVKNLFKL